MIDPVRVFSARPDNTGMGSPCWIRSPWAVDLLSHFYPGMAPDCLFALDWTTGLKAQRTVLSQCYLGIKYPLNSAAPVNILKYFRFKFRDTKRAKDPVISFPSILFYQLPNSLKNELRTLKTIYCILLLLLPIVPLLAVYSRKGLQKLASLTALSPATIVLFRTNKPA